MWGLVDVSGTSVAELSVYLSDHSAQALHREAGTTCKNNIDFMFSHFMAKTIYDTYTITGMEIQFVHPCCLHGDDQT